MMKQQKKGLTIQFHGHQSEWRGHMLQGLEDGWAGAYWLTGACDEGGWVEHRTACWLFPCQSSSLSFSPSPSMPLPAAGTTPSLIEECSASPRTYTHCVAKFRRHRHHCSLLHRHFYPCSHHLHHRPPHDLRHLLPPVVISSNGLRVELGCLQNAGSRYRLASRKNIGGTWGMPWTQCLQARKWLTTNDRQVHIHLSTSGLYASLSGITIGVFFSHKQRFLHHKPVNYCAGSRFLSLQVQRESRSKTWYLLWLIFSVIYWHDFRFSQWRSVCSPKHGMTMLLGFKPQWEYISLLAERLTPCLSCSTMTATLVLLYGIEYGKLLLEPKQTKRQPVLKFGPQDLLPTWEEAQCVQAAQLWHIKDILYDTFPSLCKHLASSIFPPPSVQ